MESGPFRDGIGRRARRAGDQLRFPRSAFEPDMGRAHLGAGSAWRAGLLFLALGCAVIAGGFSRSAPRAFAAGPSCSDGILLDGALYKLCIPANWNRKLVLLVPGLRPAQAPLSLSTVQMGNTDFLANAFTNLGYAYGTTSLRKSGINVLEGIDDLKQLVQAFNDRQGAPSRVYLLGFSQGGLITTLAVERNPTLFSGGVAACAPLGDYRSELNYVFDLRVLFDYYFANVIPGTTINVPPEVILGWETTYAPRAKAALLADPKGMAEMMRVGNMATPVTIGSDQSALADTIVGLLSISVLDGDDARKEVHGQFFDNRQTIYAGSADDAKLNSRLERYTADGTALAELTKYGTSGGLNVPLISLHTTGDQVVPYSQEAIYTKKAAPAWRHLSFLFTRDGHCNFNPWEIEFALLLLDSIA